MSEAQRREVHKRLIASKHRYPAYVSQWTSTKLASDWRRHLPGSVSLVVAMRKILH